MRLLAALGLFAVATSALALDCPAREYAELKDLAATPAGQVALARDRCDARRRFDASIEKQGLYSKGGMFAQAAASGRDAGSCQALMEKIGTALEAANAWSAIQYSLDKCQGPPPTK